MRHNLLGVWLFVCFGASASFGQGLTPTTPAQEYIRLNGSVVAIENAVPATPAATIISPAAGTVVSGNSVSVTVSVSGVVTSVQLRIDGTNVGAPAASPYTLAFDATTLGDGSHTLTVMATGPGGTATSSPVNVTVSNVPAISISITSPSAGATISNSIAVTVSTSGPVTSVQLQVDGVNTGSPATSAPFGLTLNTTALSNESHTLTAVASRATGGPVNSSPIAVTVNNPVQPPSAPFITAFSSTTVRSDYTGLVGMQFTVGSAPLTVTDLGRMYISGSGAHTVKLVNAANGADVPGGAVTLSLTGATAGQFKYAALASPLTLAANTAYYLVSQETSGGDPWYEYGPVSSTSAASVNGPVYWLNGWVPPNVSSRRSFVPVNFKYTSSTSFGSISITSPAAGTTLSGSVAVAVATGGPVTSVQLQVDDTNAGNPAAAAPFGLTLDTTTRSNGSRTLTAVASGTSGTAYSLPVPVTLSNTSPPPSGTPFVTGFSSTTLRSDYTGFVGMQFTVGGTPLTITDLGRVFLSGGGTHVVKLVQAGSNGADVAGGSVSVSLAGGTAGQFQYAALASPVTLAANTTYYLVSQETVSGDPWYESGPVASTGVASVGGPVFGNGNWTAFGGSAGKSYVPVNFKYASGAPSISISITSPSAGAIVSGAGVAVAVSTGGPVASVQLQVDGVNAGSPATSSPFGLTLNTTALSNGSHTLTAVASDGAGGTATSLPVSVTVSNALPSTPFVTGFSSGSSRNNYTGFVGMKVSVGATPVTVTQLGRLYVSGSGTHTVKLVAASTGVDVAGGSVSVSGGTAGQFQYATLTSPVTLAANTAYYVVSGETVGGDAWYDDDTTITATSVASLNGPVYGSGSWTVISSLAGRSFVPVNFKYQTGAPPSMTISITSPAAGATISGTSAAVTVSTSGPVASVQLQVDGVNNGGPATSPPFNLTLDTTALSNAAHTLTAVASDGSGGTVTSAPVSVTVNNGPPPTGTAFVTSFGTSTTRADFTGFVGMQFTVGATPITVTQLGRLYVSGGGTHTLKLVLASSGADVPGGSVSLAIAGGTAGQFQYASLGAGVTLAANTAYYVVSGETNGGDPWHDWIPVTTTGAASVNGPVYGSASWTVISSLAGQAYGPVSFKY